MDAPLLTKTYGLFVPKNFLEPDYYKYTFQSNTFEGLVDEDMEEIESVLTDIEDRCHLFHVYNHSCSHGKVFERTFSVAYFLNDVLRVIDEIGDGKVYDCLCKNVLYSCCYSEIVRNE